VRAPGSESQRTRGARQGHERGKEEGATQGRVERDHKECSVVVVEDVVGVQRNVEDVGPGVQREEGHMIVDVGPGVQRNVEDVVGPGVQREEGRMIVVVVVGVGCTLVIPRAQQKQCKRV